MVDSPKSTPPLSPLAEDALGRADNAQVVEFIEHMRKRREKPKPETSCGLYQETPETLSGGDYRSFPEGFRKNTQRPA